MNISLIEILPPPHVLVLDSIDVEVDGAVEGCEEVADAGDVGHPSWPGRVLSQLEKFPDIWNPLHTVATYEHWNM